MKKKLGIRALAAMLAASVVMSASTGMVSAKNFGAGVSATGDVSDTSAASETSSRAAEKNLSSSVSIEGAALNGTKVPTGLVGAGTADSPYQIGSVNDLVLMNSYINYSNYASKEFILTKDIDLGKLKISDFTESEGIWSVVSAKASLSGNSNVYFHFNGNGHKLFGLNLTTPKEMDTCAIFGYVNVNSVIENLTVDSCVLRVGCESDGAFAVLAVQNCGTIRKCTMTNCLLDARPAGVQQRASDAGYVSGTSSNRVNVGYAVGVADNAGKVQNFTATGSDANRGVFVKGGRRFVGIVAGQNRDTISDATVSGMRILCYGSQDADAAINGKGTVAAYVGGIVGRNGKTGAVTSSSITFKYGSDILFGDAVGGIAGENEGRIEDATVTGSCATGSSVTSATANLYGSGRFGAIAGVSSGVIKSGGAYDVGFSFAGGDAQNAYGGVVGANSGLISGCAASGGVDLQASASAGVGGLIGCVQTGTTLLNNYAVVSASQQGVNVGALVGKNGTTAYIGQNNYWTSQGSGLSTPVPAQGEGLNDLTPATPVIVLTQSTAGMTFGAAALAWSWQGGKATAAADFTKPFTIDNKAIRLNKTTNSVTLACTNDGAVGEMTYFVSLSVPAGVSGRKLSARVSVPVFVTNSASSGAGSSVKNPIVLSSANQMRIMQYAPDGHYQLKADITLGNDWTPIDFTGTLNGDGHTLRISKPLFTSVSGSRNGSVSAADWKYSGSNLISGYIYDMTIVPTTCVCGSVFGDVQNATLRDVTYTVNSADDGFVALSGAKSGALIDTLSGNAFLFRCTVSVPIAVTAGDAEGIGALVGYASGANLIVENCTTSSLISIEKNTANVGGLFGNIASGKTELINCSATGCVYVPAAVSEVRAKIMIGAAAGGVTASGCTYVTTPGVAGGSVAKEAAPFTAGLTELKPESEEAKQSAEDTRSMLELIDPELIDEAEEVGLSQDGNGVYLLTDAADMQAMATLINGTASSRTAVFELQNDIDMNGAELKMATAYNKQFAGTFRSAAGHQYTLSNFKVTGTTSQSTAYTNAAALFCYASSATFQDFKLSNVTVTNNGIGSAVLVGFADKSGTSGAQTAGTTTGAASDCTFTNIEISDCTVTSGRSVSGTAYSLTNSSLAGTLIGCVWSSSAGNVYTIKGITVKDCTVQNTGAGGAWGIGGLIGESRLKKQSDTTNTGTLCIGGSNAADKIVLEHVTVTGYGFVGGVIGKAGWIHNTTYAVTPPTSGFSYTVANYHGGLNIQNVEIRGKTVGSTVQRSTITAGNGANPGGCCGGILAAEIVGIGRTSISNCTVSDTTITSNNNLSTITSYTSDCGGIAGHMSGTVSNCEVKDSTISSCTAGGIVGRPSRKSDTAVGASDCTLLTIDGCKVTGSTVITVDDSFTGTNYEAGGMLASARFANVLIQNCGVGSNVEISGKFLRAGGFIGYAYSTNANHSVNIQNSVSTAKVEILSVIYNSSDSVGSAVGGVVADANMTNDRLHINGCVIDGELNDNTYYCGGVIGRYYLNTACTNLVANCTVTAKLQTTEEAITKTANCAGRILAFLKNATVITNNASYWMGASTSLADAFPGNIVSSYPYSFADVPCFGSHDNNGTNKPMSDYSTLVESYLTATAGCLEDVNMPGGTNYLHGGSSAVAINDSNVDSNNIYTISITNQSSYASGAGARLAFDQPADDATLRRYAGWVSTANGDMEVVVEDSSSNATTPTSVNVKAKNDGSAGITANYKVKSAANSTVVCDPEDGTTPILIAVMVPVTLTDIPSLIRLPGNGLENDPWLIRNLADLDSMRQLNLSVQTTTIEVNGTPVQVEKKYYKLVNDITIDPAVFDANGDYNNNGAFFKPITGKNAGGAFECVFDGNGKTISGLKMNSSDTSEKTGLFALTENATIKRLTIADSEIHGSGLYVGGLVGTADHTTFEGVTISGTTVAGSYASGSNSAYAGALAAYVTDSSAVCTTLQDVSVTNAYFTGGLFGHAHYSGTTGRSNTISGTTIEGLTVTSKALDTNTAYDGTHSGKVDAAGGIAAEFAGSITGPGSYTYLDTTDPGNPTTVTVSASVNSIQAGVRSVQTGGFGDGETPEYSSVDVPVAITGANASAVVGFADETNDTAAAFDAVCSISGVTVGSDPFAATGSTPTVTVTSANNSVLASAGGIVGKVRTNDNDNDTNYVSPPKVELTVENCVVNSDVSISAGQYAGGVLGNCGLTDGTITIKTSKSFAAVRSTYSGGAAGAIAGRIYTLKVVWIDNCAASGTLKAMSNAGGVIGIVDGNTSGLAVAAGDLTAQTGQTGLITNTVFSVKSIQPINANDPDPKQGVLIGAVTTTMLTPSIAGLNGRSPFSNIYYSTYDLPQSLYVTVQEMDGDLPVENTYIKLTGDDLYKSYRDTFIDLMDNFAYYSTDVSDWVTSIKVLHSGLLLNSSNIRLHVASVVNNNTVYDPVQVNGGFWDFTCPTNVRFRLDSVYSVNKANRINFEFHETSGTVDGVTLTVQNDGSGKAVFRYDNGLLLAMDLMASGIQGDGSAEHPYLIERIGHLDTIRTYPGRNYILAADIDFTPTGHEVTRDGQTVTVYYTAHGEALITAGAAAGSAAIEQEELTADELSWVSGWEDWAQVLTTTPFSGTLDGEYYPWVAVSGGASGGDYNTSGTQTAHTISGLHKTTDYTTTDPQTNQTTTYTIAGVGLFPKTDYTAEVKNLKFDDCSFVSTVDADCNVGILVGENYGRINNVTVENSAVTCSTIRLSGYDEIQRNHVGAIAGVSFVSATTINSQPVTLGVLDTCEVSSTTVTSSHCAGGIVGGGAQAKDCTVTNVTVNGRQYAGGIAGGTLSMLTSPPEVDPTLLSANAACSFTNCEVEASTIQSDESEVESAVGGILGCAESGSVSPLTYRSIRIDHCTVDEDTEVKSRAISSSDTATKEAGGILGKLESYYEGFVIESCASYATVSANGNKNYEPSASALIGIVPSTYYHKPYDDSAAQFRLINNICSGTIKSTRFAGGVCGYFDSNCTGDSGTAGYAIPANAGFAVGNIISAKFETLPDTGGLNVNSDEFGVFMGYCGSGSFASSSIASSTMTQNYYSSYVCRNGDAKIKRFGTGSPVSACDGLFDVAVRTSVNTPSLNVESSLKVNNYEYVQLTAEPETYAFSPTLKTEGGQPLYEQTVSAPRVVSMDNDDPVVRYPSSSSPLDMPVNFQFNVASDPDQATLSSDFATVSTSIPVYTTGLAQDDVRTLQLLSFAVDPSGSTFYSAAKTNQNHVSLTVLQDPDDCLTEHFLVADLGYGLKVGIVIETKSGSGTADAPYVIPDAKTFAHYFFGNYARNPDKLYKTRYYKQTADIDYDDIVRVLAGTADALESDEFTGANATVFTPIGDRTNGAFTGGYDGGGHRITNFHYEQELIPPAEGSSAYSYAIKDVGLFGYVEDQGDAHHFKNLHIELKETGLASDDMEDDTKASICGAVNTGALVGFYKSTRKINNCSVVYGTVRSGEYRSGILTTGVYINTGGLVGYMLGAAELENCFSSTNIRAGENYSSLPSGAADNYSGGGLVGYQESGATSGSKQACTYDHCFCSSDVIAPKYVGGFVGRVRANYTKAVLTNCSSTATVTGLTQVGGSGSTGTSIVTGYAQASDTSFSANTQFVQANNVFVAGMNTTEYSNVAFTNLNESQTITSMYYPLLFGTGTLMTGSGSIYYDADALGRITVPNGTANPNILRITNALCDSSGTEIPGTKPFTAMTTDALLQSSFTSLGDQWTASDGVLYPVLKMLPSSSELVFADPYFAAFSQLAALPVKTDSREANDVTIDRMYSGVTYPTTISKTLGANGSALSIVASKYSAWSEDPSGYTGAQANYDYLLSGNSDGSNDRADMLTDLLFNRGTDSTNTSTYNRTDVRSDYQILRNTYLTKSYDDGTVGGYTFTRGERSPFVRVSGTVSVTVSGKVKSIPAHRTIHIGLRGSAATSYVATERQLRAISSPEASGKFYDAFKDTIVYDTTTSKNIRICADITFNPVNRTRFTPIADYKFTATGDQYEGAFGFDGSNCEIRNLYISDFGEAGLFSTIGGTDYPKINNLILRNPDVSGTNKVGALVAYIESDQAVEINNCMIIGGSVSVSSGSSSSVVGGLVGYLKNVTNVNRKIEQIGVVGVQISVDQAVGSVSSAGLVFGNISDAKINNVYAVGELKDVSANNVGILAGTCTDCEVNRVVTSGYVANPYSNGNVGGVFGYMSRSGSTTTLKNAESTAFVSGSQNVGGIVGSTSGAVTLDRVIFAGSTGGSATNRSVIAGYKSNATTVTYAFYNSDLQHTATESAYNPTTTLALIRGTSLIPLGNTDVTAKSILSSGFTVINDNSDPDNGKYKYTDATGGSYVYDTTSRYYPNPVSLVSDKTDYVNNTNGKIGHVISDAYKAGLSFALSRINLSYAGTAGTVKEYDQISATTPISINVFSSVLDDSKVSNDDTGIQSKSADSVTVAEYTTSNTPASGNDVWLENNGVYLSPDKWPDTAVQTGVRATLNTGSGSTFEGVTSPLYRFLIVDAVKVVKVGYIVNYDNTASALGTAATDIDKLVLMVQTQDTNLSKTFSSNAVTSKFQDSDTSSGAYTVKYRNILVKGDKIYVDAFLPSGFKVSSYTATSPNSGVTWDGTNNYVQFNNPQRDANDKTVSVVVTANITADPGWGIRDMSGGIG